MKKLFLLRHAQALSLEIGGEDINRHLAPEGETAARDLGVAMRTRSYKPDLILCSPAARTRETLSGLITAFEDEKDSIRTEIRDNLYDASRSELLAVIQNTDNRYRNLLIVAHNPAIYELSVTLAVRGADSLMHKLSGGFKPGTMSVLECPCRQWDFFQPGDNALIDLLDPLDYSTPSAARRT